MIPVRIVEDVILAEKISESYLTNPIALWLIDENGHEMKGKAHNIVGSDTKEIMDKVLGLLPNHQILNEEDFQVCFHYFLRILLKNLITYILDHSFRIKV